MIAAERRERSATRCLQLTLVLYAASSLFPRPAIPQESQPITEPQTISPATGVPALTAESLQSQIKSLQENPDLDTAARSKSVELLQKAVKELESVKRFDAEARRLETLVQEAATRLVETQRQLVQPPTEIADPGPEATLEELQQQLSEEQTSATEQEQLLVDQEAEIARRAPRRVEVPGRLAEAKRQLEEVRKQLAAPPAADESPQVTEATKQLLQSRQRALEREARLLEREIPAYDATDRLLASQRDLAARNAAQAKRAAAKWQELVNRRRQVEAREHAREADALIEQVHPAVRTLAEEVATSARELVDVRWKLARQITEAATAGEGIDRETARLHAEFRELKERAERAGFTNALGMLLRQQRSTLPDLRSLNATIGQRQTELSNLHLKRIELENQRSSALDLESLVEETTAALSRAAPDDRERIAEDVRRVLEAKRRYLAAAIQDVNSALDRLATLDAKQRELANVTHEQADFISEHILWVRSAVRLGPNSLGDLTHSLAWFAGGLRGTGRLLGDDVGAHFAFYGLAALLFVGLLLRQRHFRERLQEAGVLAARRTATSMGPTWQAIGYTMIIALFKPGLPALLGWRVWTIGPVGSFSRSFGLALLVTSALWSTLDSFRQILRPNGLGGAHCGWPSRSTTLVRKSLRILILLALPPTFVCLVTVLYGQELYLNSLGRVCAITALCLLAVTMHQILRPSGHVLEDAIGQEKAGWLARTRYLWHPLGAGVPVALAVLAFLGYFYTSRQLTVRVIETFWLVLCILVIDALLKRWILLAYRALAMKQARERRQAAQAQADATASVAEPATGGDDLAAIVEDPAISLAASNAQIRKLFKVVLVAVALAGVWVIWSDVFPAFAILRRVPLWPSAVPYTEGVGIEGVEAVEWITLAELFVALAIGVVTLLAARNLPGLLEFTLLRRLPVDAGIRYATSTICRYIITVAGLVMVFRILGFAWESVQWLIAAMSVGLGFGLQEIFANFVSGLILLFERPIRVGDTVTVSGVTGAVSRIRIRATTIIDWDRKELVVPNREFVTGQLINWTLSDPVLRVVIRVGIAYGSNTRLAKQLLLNVAHDNPNVLEEPAPTVLFWEFGESSLNFELRVFVNSIHLFRMIPDDLNLAIDDAFREHGIEIAFPQRDLHLRSVEPVISIESTQNGKLQQAAERAIQENVAT